MPKVLKRRWESRGKRYFVELFEDTKPGYAPLYSYRVDNGGGFLGAVTYEAAIAKCEEQASFAPSKLKRVL